MAGKSSRGPNNPHKKMSPRTGRSAGAGNGTHAHLTVGQTARILGISPSTLRLWEAAGLITPIRSRGSYRLYSTRALETLKRIHYLRTVKHLNLAGIKHVLGENERDGSKSRSASEDLGPRLRRLRRQRKLRLHEAAAAAGISAGFLSALERSQANPSVATVHRLAAVYGVNVHRLFKHRQTPKRVIRPRERRLFKPHPGVRVEFLSTSARSLKAMLFRVAPGAGSEGSYSHEGEEFVFVLEGQLEIWLDELERYTLSKGDTLSFTSTYGHRWRNPSHEKNAVLVWVNTTPDSKWGPT